MSKQASQWADAILKRGHIDIAGTRITVGRRPLSSAGEFSAEIEPNVSVSTYITPNNVPATLAHEIGHAVGFVTGAFNSPADTQAGDDEVFANAFAVGFIAALDACVSKPRAK